MSFVRHQKYVRLEYLKHLKLDKFKFADNLQMLSIITTQNKENFTICDRKNQRECKKWDSIMNIVKSKWVCGERQVRKQLGAGQYLIEMSELLQVFWCYDWETSSRFNGY